MKAFIKENLQPAFRLLLIMTLICGLGYTLLVTGMGQLFFYQQANGSIVTVSAADGSKKNVGSQLLGQPFTESQYLIGRPVGTASQLSPVGKEQEDLVAQRVAFFKALDPTNQQAIPMDLVTQSGSGVDPEISLEAAQYQVARIAKERQISQEAVEKVIQDHTSGKLFGTIGESRVNVLGVNIALDELE
ncbi:K(+)-transporting ATPase subunit C [Isobaculum melis]|uniref:Potassium-transporting ATPase KdpC subunit n=1 Tax=Isobaculum melis TaxID=142588 RepID=A0A1H9TGL0_9LACT|nr:K(+)-transporting ATPase subunit C [Isobaculum melis]SER95979.1 K+-transporting ATPase ATPase C chain [Isobaculum melis]